MREVMGAAVGAGPGVADDGVGVFRVSGFGFRLRRLFRGSKLKHRRLANAGAYLATVCRFGWLSGLG